MERPATHLLAHLSASAASSLGSGNFRSLLGRYEEGSRCLSEALARLIQDRDAFFFFTHTHKNFKWIKSSFRQPSRKGSEEHEQASLKRRHTLG